MGAASKGTPWLATCFHRPLLSISWVRRTQETLARLLSTVIGVKGGTTILSLPSAEFSQGKCLRVKVRVMLRRLSSAVARFKVSAYAPASRGGTETVSPAAGMGSEPL